MLTNPKSECGDMSIRLPQHKCPNSSSRMKNPTLSCILKEICTARMFWAKHFEKIQLKYGWEKVSKLECFFVHREKILLGFLDDIRIAEQKQNINQMWKVLKQGVDFGRRTSFFDHVHLRCTLRQCDISKNIVDKRTKPCLFFHFRRSNRKITMLGKSEYLIVVL